MGMAVEISSALVLRIMRSVRTASLCDGQYRVIEHCGILRGRDERITAADFASNVSDEPEKSFEIDPAALIAAYRKERRAGGLRVIGFFHTHPDGSCAPSKRDAENAAPDGKIWLIASNEGAILWRAVENGAIHGRFEHVIFDLREGSQVIKGCPGIEWRGLELERHVKMDLEVRGVI
jgi:proteasome lid subunit RPN8/RPN11